MLETPSVILLHGNDEFAISEHIEKLCAGLGDPSAAGMNISRFDGRQCLILRRSTRLSTPHRSWHPAG